MGYALISAWSEGVLNGLLGGGASVLGNAIIEQTDQLFQQCQLKDEFDYQKATIIVLSTFTIFGGGFHGVNRIAKKIDSVDGGWVCRSVTVLGIIAQLGKVFTPGIPTAIGVCSSGMLLGTALKILTLSLEL